jgi:hypothetical protein
MAQLAPFFHFFILAFGLAINRRLSNPHGTPASKVISSSFFPVISTSFAGLEAAGKLAEY